ncbi:esterase/lipase family protein [Microbulbifer sp. 2201CG32-9]|uniref:esterase/lipase family protein n=1 Tax=Microbulbifer sp. 2201CG32-9 TaxID=3232309 RepID=UPI00345BCB5F
MRRAMVTAAICLGALSVNAHSACVILLHGLAKSDASMAKLERAINASGYKTVNVDYPSTDFPIEELAHRAIGPALQACSGESEINFVTHSLGGILVRQYLSRYDIPNLNRVVMLGPPNKGSEVVDKLGNFPGFRFVFGEAGLQLGTGALSVPRRLGRANFDVGIIAGTRSINLLLSQLIPDTDDGKVSVSSTRLEGMKDHLQMPVTHVFMMKNPDVIKQVIHYLRHGTFARDGDGQDGSAQAPGPDRQM